MNVVLATMELYLTIPAFACPLYDIGEDITYSQHNKSTTWKERPTLRHRAVYGVPYRDTHY
jgi:hypothetical protein